MSSPFQENTFDYLREAIRTRGQLENAQKCVEGFRLDLKDATERSKEQQKLPLNLST
jgi:hypothetical protein